MIIITGASGGIGRFLYQKFQSEGLNVIGTYNSKPSKDLYKLDISSSEEVKSFVNDVRDKLENIIFIGCSGINYNAFAHKADVNEWRNVIDVNLNGSFNLINTLLPIMREQKYGRIINFSSVVAQIGVLGTSAYASSKAAFWGLVKVIAKENAINSITINNINLGYFEIGMGMDIPSEIREEILHRIPTKSFGDPEDIYTTVKYIIETPYLNGASIDLNGAIS